ncbi:hypothetical protein [Kitasatospora sp. HPMI-4]|uniref:hypothetical protein n=1 Tax=Kitasatospora sp. HPMI-4 TaxID=3448443 RepID=UPI003F1CC231
MADNETVTAAPVATTPVAEANPVEHTLNTVDPAPILNVLQAAQTEQPAGEPVAAPAQPKPGKDFEPLGNLGNCP